MNDIPVITGGAFRLTLDWLRRLVDAVRSRTVVAGRGLRATVTPAGTVLSLAEASSEPGEAPRAKTDAGRAMSEHKDDDVPDFRSVQWRKKKPALQLYGFDEKARGGNPIVFRLELAGRKLRLRDSREENEEGSSENEDFAVRVCEGGEDDGEGEGDGESRHLGWRPVKLDDSAVELPKATTGGCPFLDGDEGEDGEDDEPIPTGPPNCGNPLNGTPGVDDDYHPMNS